MSNVGDTGRPEDEILDRQTISAANLRLVIGMWRSSLEDVADVLAGLEGKDQVEVETHDWAVG